MMGDKIKQLKMAVIAGASHALKYKEENSKATDGEILRKVSSEMRTILENIDSN